MPGKTPQVDAFTGDDIEIRLDDWLPTLDCATVWNDWYKEEGLMQLAGHLHRWALLE